MFVALERFLQYINVGLLFAMVGVYYCCGNNEYINFYTIVLAVILILQVLLFLQYSIKRNSIILTVLSFVLTFFYIFRVITLNYVPFSNVFNRYLYTSNDINNCLLYILFANLFLFIGVYLSHTKKTEKLSPYSEKIKCNKIIFLLFVSIILTFSSIYDDSLALILINYLTLFFLNARYLILACVIYLLFNEKKIDKRVRVYLYALIMLYVVASMFAGSRQAIFSIVIFFIIASFSVFGKILVKWKYILASIMLIPLMIVMFLFATLLRQNDMAGGSLNDKIEILNNNFASSSGFTESDFKFFLVPIFDRIGFLDYATEIVTQKERYSVVINTGYYFQSIIDNVLTPGFNVFGTPKASNALIFIYENKGTPTHEEVASRYQSDQFTLYGELYCLFGLWLSLPLFTVIGYLFNKILSKSCSNYRDYLIKGGAILIWYVWVNSFGIDWLILDILSLAVSGWFVLFILKLKCTTNAIKCKC